MAIINTGDQPIICCTHELLKEIYIQAPFYTMDINMHTADKMSIYPTFNNGTRTLVCFHKTKDFTDWQNCYWWIEDITLEWVLKTVRNNNIQNADGYYPHI